MSQVNNQESGWLFLFSPTRPTNATEIRNNKRKVFARGIRLSFLLKLERMRSARTVHPDSSPVLGLRVALRANDSTVDLVTRSRFLVLFRTGKLLYRVFIVPISSSRHRARGAISQSPLCRPTELRAASSTMSSSLTPPFSLTSAAR